MEPWIGDLIRQGDTERDAGRFEAAAACYRQIIERAPDVPEGHYKMGVLHGRQDQKEDAERCYRHALGLRPGYPEAMNNLGLVCRATERLQDAEAQFREILANLPDYFEAHINLGNLLDDTGRSMEALYHFRRAVALRPDSALASERAGSILRNQGHAIAAIEHLRRALELDPRSSVAWNNLGASHFIRGEHTLADHAFGEALALDSNEEAAWNNRLFLSNLMSLSRDEAFARHRAYGDHLRARLGPTPVAVVSGQLHPERRLRIGFVSGDFRHHSVAYFLASFLPHLDRSRVETVAYSNNRKQDDMTRRLRPMFQRWVDIVDMPDTYLAEMIRRDRIDVLVDLSGHTNHNRLPLFALKPAPVQLSWIGYPATTGVDAIDYRLTDALADPTDEDQRFHTEMLWRLPGPFLCFSPPPDAPEPVPSPTLAGGPVTFGSFNARVKLGDECVALWCKVLEAVPGSRLLLKSIIGAEEAEAKEQLAASFVARGIASERVEVLSSITATADHLARYGRVDIALDTFSYHGTTTTCEALWMGVPVVTLAGNRHVSRVGVSLLSHVGLTELIAHDPDEFVDIAVALARSPERLSAYRTGLRERLRASPLLDGISMARRFEDATREMWRRFCERHGGAQADAAIDAPEPLRLHIGGKQPKEGWKILNVQPDDDVDLIGDIRNLDGIADESCAEVYCSHVLEHLAMNDVLPVLKELRRILVPGGRLNLAVPDLDALSDLFRREDLEQAQRFQVIRMIFGGQVDEYDFHKTGFNFDFMTGYLAMAGFSSVEQVPSFGLFDDASEMEVAGTPISLNLVVEK